jgi:drug/metabolite transporter (DMT)-like permease
MATMVVWGLNFPMVKTLTQWFDTALLASARIVAATVAFWVLLAWQRPPRMRLSARQWLGLVVCAFSMVYLNQVFFAGGLHRTGAANGALIMATSPMVAGLLATLTFGERLHRRHLAALALGFGGVAVVVLHRPGAALSSAGLGDLMILGCVVTYALGGVILQHLAPRVDMLAFNTWVYTLGMGMLLLHLGIEQGSSLTVQRVFPGWWPWTLVAISAVFATTLSNWLWAVAIGRIGVARATVFVYWVPVFGMGFSALLLGETLNAWYGLGLAMVLAGSRLAAGAPRRPVLTPPVE